eukprot:Lithocolla_globosa_v1_NODE_1389_length_2613_cov_14.652549.p2 type:complete len:207 gc:universal NODE_1389_length_2613_cov_14.652549:1120-1740(+)
MSNTKGGLDQMTTKFLKVLIPCERAKMQDNESELPQTKMGIALKRMVDAIWDGKEIPDTLSIAAIFSLMKKGDPIIRDNYRGISLISVVIKVLTKTVAIRIQKTAEHLEFFDEAQAGFRSLEEAIAQYCALLDALERRSVAGLKSYIVFIDLKKAYDTVPHEALFKKLESYGFSGKCLQYLRNLYSKSNNAKVISGLVEYFVNFEA